MISNTLYDFCNKVKRQCINFSLFNAASLGQYIRHVFPFIVYYFLGMGKSCLPLNITIELNYDCNLRCKFCFLNFTSKDTYAEKKAYLTYADIKQILTMFSRKGVAFLLTGGELALRSDLPDILKLIKQNKIKCGIFTNATLLNSIVSDCIIEYGLDFIYFSLDGPQDIHDKLRGDNAFDRTYKNIRYLSGNRKDLRPKIIMNSLILQENYKNLTEVIDIACELKIDGIAFDFLTFLSSDELTLHQNSFIKRFPRDKYKSFVYAHDFLDTEFKDLLSIIRVVKMYAKKRRMKIFLSLN